VGQNQWCWGAWWRACYLKLHLRKEARTWSSSPSVHLQKPQGVRWLEGQKQRALSTEAEEETYASSVLLDAKSRNGESIYRRVLVDEWRRALRLCELHAKTLHVWPQVLEQVRLRDFLELSARCYQVRRWWTSCQLSYQRARVSNAQR